MNRAFCGLIAASYPLNDILVEDTEVIYDFSLVWAEFGKLLVGKEYMEIIIRFRNAGM